MSFSKAKIQRFNEIKVVEAPSLITQSKSKVDLKNKIATKVKVSSGQSSENGSSNAETNSVKSTPCFRTPNPINTKKVLSSKSKPTVYSRENVELEALKEKIVECENKDASIKDLTEQLEEIMGKMVKLETLRDKLLSDKVRFEVALQEAQNAHVCNLQKLTETFEEELAVSKCREMQIKNEIAFIKKDYESFKEASTKDVSVLKEDFCQLDARSRNALREYSLILEAKSAELAEKSRLLTAVEHSCINIQNRYTSKLERLQKEHQLEIQHIEFEMLKTMTELQKERDNASSKFQEMEKRFGCEVEKLQSCFEDERKSLVLQSEEKMKAIELMYSQQNAAAESQFKERLQEIETKWKNRLDTQEKEAGAILRECQTISEYSIFQCEVEKQQVRTELAEKTQSLEKLQNKYYEKLRSCDEITDKYKKLQTDLSNIILELNDARKTLGEELEGKKEQIAKLTKEKMTYEVTIKNSQVTIDVLTKRLINSDKDVEQLKKELNDCEQNLLKYEEKCLQLTSELKQAQNFNEELEMQYEFAVKLNKTEIECIAADLHTKVDSYKSHVEYYTKKLGQEGNLKKEIMQQINDAYKVINNLRTELEYYEMVKLQSEFEIEQSKNELEDYRIREMDWSIVKDKFEEQIRELEHNLELKEDEVSALKVQLAKINEEKEQERELRNQEKEDEESIYRKFIQLSGKYDALLQTFQDLERRHLNSQQVVTDLKKEQQDNAVLKAKYEKKKGEYENLLAKVQEMENQKNNLENTDEEKNELVEKIHHLEKELKHVSCKYAHLAGHQNNKQKIKHLEDLKMKNDELMQTKMDLEFKLRAQTKSIEKLKTENSDLKKRLRKNKLHEDDKENFGSPNRSLHSNRVESPFRERN